MRQLNYEQTFQCDLETFFEQIVFYPEFQRQLLINRGDSNVQVNPWFYKKTNEKHYNGEKEAKVSQIYNRAMDNEPNEPMTRKISFETKNKAPSLVSRTLQLPSEIKCELHEEFEWIYSDVDGVEYDENENSMVMSDESNIRFGLRRFKHVSDLVFVNISMKDSIFVRSEWDVHTNSAKDVVVCKLRVKCEFKTSIWGVTGIVEGFMESDAKISFGDWLSEAQKHLERYRAEQADVLQKTQLTNQMEDDHSDDENNEDDVISMVSSPTTSKASHYPSSALSVITNDSDDESFYSIRTQNRPSSVVSNDRLSSSSKKVSIVEPASALLDRSAALANLKQSVHEVRALVQKTEVRLEGLEQEFSNHELDVIIRLYMQRIEQLYRKQNEQLELLNRTSPHRGQRISDVSHRQRGYRSALFWFGIGALVSSLFSVLMSNRSRSMTSWRSNPSIIRVYQSTVRFIQWILRLLKLNRE